MGVVTQTEKPVASPRVERVLDGVDRGFPLLWVLLYLLLPVSGWSEVMFDSWFDQARDLEALTSVLADGRADAIANNVIGPAYIATAAALHWVLGLDATRRARRAQPRLVRALDRLRARPCPRARPPLRVRSAARVRRRPARPRRPRVRGGTWHWSDVPWSHFFAAFLAVTLYVVRFAPERPTVATAAITGGVLALLALTRSFELLSLVLAWGIALALLALLRLSGPRRVSLSHLASAVVAFAATTVAVYAATGKRGSSSSTGTTSTTSRATCRPPEIADTPTFSPWFVPVKLVQLFYEPCFYSMCRLSDYAGGATALPAQLGEAGNYRLWSQPLAIQLPSLVLLPLCMVAVAAIVVWAARNRVAAAPRAREIRLLAETTIAAAGIVVGYAASTMTGSNHLRYGFARDFLLPALLSGLVAAGLFGVGLWLLLARIGPLRIPPTSIRLSTESVLVLVAFVVSAALVAGAAIARSEGLPRIESRMLGPVVYTASCQEAVCDVGHRREDRLRAADLDPGALDPDLRVRERPAAVHALRRRALGGRPDPATCGPAARRRLADSDGPATRQLRARLRWRSRTPELLLRARRCEEGVRERCALRGGGDAAKPVPAVQEAMARDERPPGAPAAVRDRDALEPVRETVARRPCRRSSSRRSRSASSGPTSRGCAPARSRACRRPRRATSPSRPAISSTAMRWLRPTSTPAEGRRTAASGPRA